MVQWLASVVMLALPATVLAAVSIDDVERVVSGIYANEVGAATGDVDADGGAGAADILAALTGLRAGGHQLRHRPDARAQRG